MARYIGGLNEGIQEKLEMNFIWSLNEAVNLAFLGERQVLKSVTRSLTTRRPSTNEFNRTGSQPTNNSSSRKPPEVNVGGDKMAPQKPINPYAHSMVGKCFRCNQPGHRSNECPT